MSEEIGIGDDFATAMQALSEAATSRAETPSTKPTAPPDLLHVLQHLAQRVDGLERSICARLDFLETGRIRSNAERGQQLQKLEEQVSALHNNESVNQKLFDSLHQELINYRDNFVRDSLQKPFIRDLLVLFDDLSAIAKQLEKAEASMPKAETAASANLTNSLHALVEILHRLEVNEIEPRPKVDLKLHKVISYEPTQIAEEDGQILSRLRRGFTWRDRVLRPEEVVAKRFSIAVPRPSDD